MIKLRKYKTSDLDRHLELLAMNGIKANKKNEAVWLKKAIKNYKKKPEFYVLAITLNNKIIGNAIAEKIKNKSCDIGFWIGKKYQNKGYATKALKLFLKHIKRKFKPKTIYASHKKGNLASARVLEKAGFKIKCYKRDMCLLAKEE